MSSDILKGETVEQCFDTWLDLCVQDGKRRNKKKICEVFFTRFVSRLSDTDYRIAADLVLDKTKYVPTIHDMNLVIPDIYNEKVRRGLAAPIVVKETRADARRFSYHHDGRKYTAWIYCDFLYVQGLKLNPQIRADQVDGLIQAGKLTVEYEPPQSGN